MPSEQQIDRLYQAVSQEVARILGSQTFEQWMKRDPVPTGDLIVFNNSFLYRENLTGTSKSKKYLCVTLDPDSEPTILQVDGRFNATFKRFPARQIEKFTMLDLRSSIIEEMASLGTIVFSLVGRIGDDQPANVALPDATSFTTLRYEPKQSATPLPKPPSLTPLDTPTPASSTTASSPGDVVLATRQSATTDSATAQPTTNAATPTTAPGS